MTPSVNDFAHAPRAVQKDRIAGMLAGVMIGDAMGMPVETWKHEKIMKLNDGRGVVGFMPSQETSYRHYIAGQTTDDWQLTHAVLRSLIRTRGLLDITDVAAEHVTEWKPDSRDWGRSTHEAIRAIKDGERDPLKPIPFRENSAAGSGTGVMMKIAGLAAAHALRATSQRDLATDCRTLGQLTHADPVASIAAYAVADAIRRRLNSKPIELEEIALSCAAVASSYTFGYALMTAKRWDSDQRREMPFKPFSALYCGVFCVATAKARNNDFEGAILEAVNAGGDADSNASAIGAIIGAGLGWSALPHAWKTFRPEYAQALDLADQLIDAIARRA